MNNRFYSFMAVLLLVVTISSGFKKDECGDEQMTSAAITQLKDYTLLQSIPFYMKKKKGSAAIENKKQLITLNRGVRYKFFTIRNSKYDGIPILSIYNNEKLENILGSTYNARFNKFYNELEFECKTTGNYCLTLSFQDGLEGCALGIFSSLIKDHP